MPLVRGQAINFSEQSLFGRRIKIRVYPYVSTRIYLTKNVVYRAAMVVGNGDVLGFLEVSRLAAMGKLI